MLEDLRGKLKWLGIQAVGVAIGVPLGVLLGVGGLFRCQSGTQCPGHTWETDQLEHTALALADLCQWVFLAALQKPSTRSRAAAQ